MSERYQDFIREQGAPFMLQHDGAPEQNNDDIKGIHWKYVIKDGFNEPRHAQKTQWREEQFDCFNNTPSD